MAKRNSKQSGPNEPTGAPFVRSNARTVLLGFACVAVCILAMIVGLFAWRWRNDPSLQYMTMYVFLMNLMLAITMGIMLGMATAFVVPLSVRRVPLKTVAGWMGIAVIAAIGFVVAANTFPFGPLGFCFTIATLVMQRTAANRVPVVSNWCPRCGYDARGIDADPCPECGLGKFHAIELHDQQRFVSKLGSVGLIAIALFWVWVTVWQWDSRFPLD